MSRCDDYDQNSSVLDNRRNKPAKSQSLGIYRVDFSIDLKRGQ